MHDGDAFKIFRNNIEVDKINDYAVADAQLEGTFIINEKGYLTLSGERSKARNLATWTIEVPKKGMYYLSATYTGSNPSTAFIYINSKQVTENFGWLMTTGNKIGEYYFPIELEKGKSTLQMEYPGRRGNQIRKLSIVKERN